MGNGEGRPEMVRLASWLRECVHPTIPKARPSTLDEVGDPDRTGGDTSLIESDLGGKARWSLHDGLQAQIDWLFRSGPERG